MRRRKIRSVRSDFRLLRGEVTLFSISVLDETINDLYHFIVLGHSPKKTRNMKAERRKKNRHPGRKKKYQNGSQW